MANTYVSNLVPRILPATLEVLREDVPLLGMANKDYSASAGKLGDTVTIQKPVALASGDVTPAMIPPSGSDIAPGYVTIPIDTWKKATFQLTQKEYMEIIAGNTVPYQVGEAVRTVANLVNAAIWAKYYQISNVAGTPATGAFASNSTAFISAAAYALDRALCPKGNRHAFISLRDANDLRTNTAYGQYYYVGEGGQENIARTGVFKSFFDFKSMNQDFNVPLHTAGTVGGGTVTLSGAHVIGDNTVLLAVAGGTGLALLAGDVITIGTETGYAPNTYSLTADLTIAAGATGTATLNKGLHSAKTTGSAVALVSGWATSVQNICGDPSGIGLVMRYPSEELMGNRVTGSSMPLIDPNTGAVLCLTHLAGYHMSQWEVSALFGNAFVDERKLLRLASYSALVA